jgi:hypothetical protein
MNRSTSISQQITPTNEPGNRMAEEKLRSLLARAKQQAMKAKPGKEESLWLLTEATLEDMLNKRVGNRD